MLQCFYALDGLGGLRTSTGAGDIFTKQSWEFLANLAFGVTALHNPSADTEYDYAYALEVGDLTCCHSSVFTAAELIRSGKTIGPRVFSTVRH